MPDFENKICAEGEMEKACDQIFKFESQLARVLGILETTIGVIGRGVPSRAQEGALG